MNKVVQSIRNELNGQLDNFMHLENEINAIADMVLNITGNIFATGVGKSENVSVEFINLLKCIGFKAFTLNTLNVLHGDVGSIKKNDLIFLFSKSGNTSELKNIIEYLPCHKIGIFCNHGQLAHLCNDVLILPFTHELETKHIQCIPTHSYISQLTFAHLLVVQILEKMPLPYEEYQKYHPSGNIGISLLTIKDVLQVSNYPKITVDDANFNIPLHQVFLEMTNHNIGCCFFVTTDNILLGLLSDGDIRRLLVNDSTVKNISYNTINHAYHSENDLSKRLVNISAFNHYKFIPVVETYNKLLGIIRSRN